MPSTTTTATTTTAAAAATTAPAAAPTANGISGWLRWYDADRVDRDVDDNYRSAVAR